MGVERPPGEAESPWVFLPQEPDFVLPFSGAFGQHHRTPSLPPSGSHRGSAAAASCPGTVRGLLRLVGGPSLWSDSVCVRPGQVLTLQPRDHAFLSSCPHYGHMMDDSGHASLSTASSMCNKESMCDVLMQRQNTMTTRYQHPQLA